MLPTRLPTGILGGKQFAVASKRSCPVPEPPSTFRDFGIIPDNLPPPAETIHCYFSATRVFGQYLATFLVAAVGLGLALIFAFAMPLRMSLLSCPAALAAFGVFLYFAARNDYGRIELQGSLLRAKHLYTGHIMEHAIGDIERLTTMVNVVRRAGGRDSRETARPSAGHRDSFSRRADSLAGHAERPGDDQRPGVD